MPSYCLLSVFVLVFGLTLKAKAGGKILDDGTVVLADGTRILPDGTRVLADGTRILADGTFVCGRCV